jgi:hypothetical protein
MKRSILLAMLASLLCLPSLLARDGTQQASLPGPLLFASENDEDDGDDCDQDDDEDENCDDDDGDGDNDCAEDCDDDDGDGDDDCDDDCDDGEDDDDVVEDEGPALGSVVLWKTNRGLGGFVRGALLKDGEGVGGIRVRLLPDGSAVGSVRSIWGNGPVEGDWEINGDDEEEFQVKLDLPDDHTLKIEGEWEGFRGLWEGEWELEVEDAE